MNRLFTLTFLLYQFVNFTSFSQLTYQKTISGLGVDYANCVHNTDDGGSIIVGRTNSFGAGNDDVYVLKLDSDGNEIWEKTIGSNGLERGESIISTLDGGYLIVGTKVSAGLQEQFYLIKTDSVGNVLWEKTYGGNSIDYGKKVIQLSDSSYVVSGTTSSYGSGQNDFYIIKVDQLGNLLFTKTIGGSQNELLWDMILTSDNKIVLCGSTISFGAGNNDGYLVNLDLNGNLNWAKTYGLNFSDRFFCITETSDNGFVLGGASSSAGAGSDDWWVLKTTSLGIVESSIIYGGSSADQLYDIVQNPDNSYSLFGYSLSYGPSGNAMLMNTDSNGNMLWTKVYGGTSYSIGLSFIPINSGFLLTGWTGISNENMFLIQTNSNGTSGCNEISVFPNQSSFIPTSMTAGLSSIGGSVAVAFSTSNVPSFTKTTLCTSCPSTFENIFVNACISYMAPSGSIHTSSEIFNDTIPNAAGCDSIITINLTINQNTFSTISMSACGSFTAPDGQVYTTSGNYTAIIPNSAGCDSTISINLTINAIPNISAGVDQTVCEGALVTLNASGGSVYTWDNSVINGVSFPPPIGINEYVVSGVSVNGCTNTDTVTVTVNALPLVNFSVDVMTGCSPLTFNVTNSTPNSQNCTWDISNGDDLIGCGTVTGLLYQVGCHDITLTTTDNNGCSNSYTAASIICVEAPPNALFSASQNSFSQTGEQIFFTNNSTGASSYTWDFGDSSPISTLVDPTHVYEDGFQDSFIVELIAFSSFGCSDTSYLTIYNTSISDSVDTDVFIPTGFSPNNDNENDTWTVSGLKNYPNVVINVFNRWGQLIFDGNSTYSSWDGTYLGEILPTADYYYIVDLGNGTKLSGVVTLKQ